MDSVTSIAFKSSHGVTSPVGGVACKYFLTFRHPVILSSLHSYMLTWWNGSLFILFFSLSLSLFQHVIPFHLPPSPFPLPSLITYHASSPRPMSLIRTLISSLSLFPLSPLLPKPNKKTQPCSNRRHCARLERLGLEGCGFLFWGGFLVCGGEGGCDAGWDGWW